jgi:hypothetical protein
MAGSKNGFCLNPEIEWCGKQVKKRLLLRQWSRNRVVRVIGSRNGLCLDQRCRRQGQKVAYGEGQGPVITVSMHSVGMSRNGL